MHQRGKLLVISFFLIGLLLASGAIWYHYAKTRWALAFWGQTTARLIVRAPEVELFRVVPSESPLESDTPDGTATEAPASNPETAPDEPETPRSGWQLDGRALQVVEQRAITETPGLIHMRMALVEDANFDITAQPPARRAWDYVFRFKNPENSVLVAVDSTQGLVRILNPDSDKPTPIGNIRPIASGMKKFLSVQFADEKPAATTSFPTKPFPTASDTAAPDTAASDTATNPRLPMREQSRPAAKASGE